MGEQKTLDLSVVIPAYLEEENLRLLLPRVLETVRPLSSDFEVVVVDTQTAMDHTERVCAELGVAYHRREGGNAFGNAVRTGIERSRGKHVVFMDADGSHAPEYISELYKHRTDHDIVIASRYVNGGATENSIPLIVMSRVLNWTYSLFLGLKCKDVSNSFKLYRGDLLRELTLTCDNFDIIEEILFKICYYRPETRVLEIPFTFKKRMFGDTKRKLIVFMASYLWTMVKLRMSVFGRGRIRRNIANRPS